MTIRSAIRNECGHTLIETVVAMALLGGVVLLIVGSVGNLMASDRSDRLAGALRLCKEELSLIDNDPMHAESAARISGNMTLHRSIEKTARLITAKLAVVTEDATDTLLVMQKTLLLP